MVRRDRRNLWKARSTVAFVALAVGMAAFAFGTAGPSGAQATEVSGHAYGHFTKVGLFGGPPSAVGPAPYVTLPSAGAEPELTGVEPQGALAQFGPAVIFGGRYPIELAASPPSGPVAVSTKGKPGPGGSVTSTASVTKHPTPVPVKCAADQPGTTNCTSVGGFGPVTPNEGDELHATCTANESGVTGSTRLVNATVSKSTDESGEPQNIEPLPEFPPPNFTTEGEITNVGDIWRTVYNEQIVEPDGSITVNGLHMYLLGRIAVGDQILGQVRCSMSGAATSATTSLAPPTTKASGAAAPAVPAAATKKESDDSALPWVLGGVGVVLVAGVVGAVIKSRRRRDTAPESEKVSNNPP